MKYLLLMKKKALIAVFVFACVVANGKPLKVVVCAGQSNMLGARSQVEELPKELQGIQSKNLIFLKKTIPIQAGKTQKHGFGPEISLAKKLSEKLKEPVGIIKFSVGGTNLAEDWSPALESSLYWKLLKKIKGIEENNEIEIVAVVWMQGESDSRNREYSKNYAANLANFVGKIRQDLGIRDLVFIAGRVNPLKSRFPYVDDVRTAQEKCNLVNYAFIDCDSFKKGSDNLHYTTEGIVEMGYRFSEAIFNSIQR